MPARTINTAITAALGNLGWSPNDQLRISTLFSYSLSDTGNPKHDLSIRSRSIIFSTERWLIAPQVELTDHSDWNGITN